jgi:hypothetical protein
VIGVNLYLLQALSFLVGEAENMARTLGKPLYT